MNKIIISWLFAAWGTALQAQTPVTSISDAERARIAIARTQLNSRFSAEDAACYRKFLVNDCLEEVKIKRREALADFRRQEIFMDASATIKRIEAIAVSLPMLNPMKMAGVLIRSADNVLSGSKRIPVTSAGGKPHRRRP